MSDRITTETLAEELGTDRQVIYESRRRGQYPGILGHRQGKRLMFYRSEVNDWLESVPKIVTDENGVIRRWETDTAYGEGETTNDANTAILWALGGIQETLRAIHNELRVQRPVALDVASHVFVTGDEDSLHEAGYETISKEEE